MIRSWGLVALTGVAQPWFGDVTTASVGLAPHNGQIAVPVASTTRYRAGDRIILEPETANQDIFLVDGIKAGGTTVLLCHSEGDAPTHVHASGVILQLSIPCMDVIIQSNAAAAVWLGPDNTVTAAGGSAFFRVDPTPSTPFRLAGSIGGSNNVRSSDGWMIGTAAQTVAVSAVVL